MTMSKPPISDCETRAREDAAAAAAGWRPFEVAWERLQETGIAAWRAGDHDQAIACWRRARRIAFWRLPRRDPRFATSVANAAMANRLEGREALARRGFARARRCWRRVPQTIQSLAPSRRARSSLFHMRLEARHWDTYVATQRQRLDRFVSETAAVLEALAEDRAPPHALFERWRGEKPPVHDAMRKTLSAALLVACPPLCPPLGPLSAGAGNAKACSGNLEPAGHQTVLGMQGDSDLRRPDGR